MGRGGFGIVYLATDTQQTEKVVVKEYFPYGRACRGGDSNIIFSENGRNGYELFIYEAFVMEKVKDFAETPAFYDFIQENNTAYIVMEYLKGITLREWIGNHGRICAHSCFAMLKPVIQCLGRMHSRGILHRDICPDNIIVSDTGTVKIIDFGSAVDLKNYSDVMAEPTYRKGFSPPEQYERNKIPGTCSDLYALCATFYFCMTGLEPEDAQKRLKEDRFIEKKGLPEVIKKGMALREKERWQDIKELLEAFAKGGENYGNDKKGKSFLTENA